MNTPKETFIPCSCGTEALHLYMEAEEDLLYISIWEKSYREDNRLTWKQRFRHCWYTLTRGKPYGDQIILDRQGRSNLLYALTDAHLVKKIVNDSNT